MSKKPSDYSRFLETAKAEDIAGVIAALKLVLADTYTLSALTQNAHWNVEGINFFQLHEEFGEQYSDLAGDVDTLAEQIRQLRAYVPVSLAAFQADSGIYLPTPPVSAVEWINALIVGHEKTLTDLVFLEKVSGGAGDLETQNLAIDLAAKHKKILWMLRASVA